MPTPQRLSQAAKILGMSPQQLQQARLVRAQVTAEAHGALNHPLPASLERAGAVKGWYQAGQCYNQHAKGIGTAALEDAAYGAGAGLFQNPQVPSVHVGNNTYRKILLRNAAVVAR